jgi:hypothetical protein
MDMGEQAGIRSGQPVRATVLAEPEVELFGQIVESSGKRLRLLLDRSIPQGAAVKVVGFEQTLLLGEVCGCQPAGHEFEIALVLEHTLVHTDELALLAQKLLEEGPTVTPAQGVRVKKPSAPVKKSATPRQTS